MIKRLEEKNESLKLLASMQEKLAEVKAKHFTKVVLRVKPGGSDGNDFDDSHFTVFN